MQLGDLAKSIPLLRKALNIREERVAADRANRGLIGGLAESYADMGRWYASSNSCREAETWYRKSLAAFHEVQGTSALTGADAELPAIIAKELANVKTGCGSRPASPK
ncbi:MAG: tetratricopeptide repeat protein [Bryobacteraceae bacterium]